MFSNRWYSLPIGGLVGTGILAGFVIGPFLLFSACDLIDTKITPEGLHVGNQVPPPPPFNEPPTVTVGDDSIAAIATTVQLNGNATDDGLPAVPGVLTTTWSLVSGPAVINFDDPHATVTTTSFPVAGSYVIKLTADDGNKSAEDEVVFTAFFSADPFLMASEGATGTENPLSFDELIDLGSKTLNSGPNTGTLVRVTNLGGAEMHLATPKLTGSAARDFAIQVDSTSLPALGLKAAGTPVELPSPLRKIANTSATPGQAMALDAQTIISMSKHKRLTLGNFELLDIGPVALDLEQMPLPLANNAMLKIDGEIVPNGLAEATKDLQVWRGVVERYPDSRVFLALSPKGANGFIEIPSHTNGIVNVGTAKNGQSYVIDDHELIARGFKPQEFCNGELLVPGGIAPLRQIPDANDPATTALTVSNVNVAFETDFQLFQKFGSSTALTNYVTSLVAAVSDQYFTDTQTTISIAYLGIHTTSNDGWISQETPGANAGDLLDEFQLAWTSGGWPAPANLAHFLSGDTLGGGIAYVNVLCNQNFGFAVSANMTGAIDWGTWTGQSAGFTWDFIVVAHEMGHNFGALHTQDYCPPLDRCYPGACNPTSSCSRGTLMGYCHLCGGLANVDLYFHPVSADIMRGQVNSSCVDGATLAPGDFVQYRLRFNPITVTGNRSAAMECGHDAPNTTQPFRIQLSGTAN